VAALVDTNILVYRVDPRFPEKQRLARSLLRRGIAENEIRLPHQAILEFIAATTRRVRQSEPLLSRETALEEAEDLLNQFEVVYPNESVVRTAVRGCAAYGLSWFDAHLWAYAEVYGLSPLYSEDFEHDRMLGAVRIVDPFQA
jgi:predicted nucleic acid-binding protein